MTAHSVLAPLHDPERRRRLETHGYAVMPLLTRDDVQLLSMRHEALGQAPAPGFHATMYSASRDHRRAVYESIEPLIAGRIRGVLDGYRIVVANFLVKTPGAPGEADSTIWFHQDWSFVDESVSRSINLWIPLVDVSEDNGCLEMVGGSQTLSNDYRAHSDPCRFTDLTPRLRAGHTRPVPVAAGDAVVYDGAVLHGSPHNRTGRRRVAIGVVLVPQDAQIVHCFRTSPAEVEVFAVEPEFFWRHTPGTRPANASLLRTCESATTQHSEDVLPRLSRLEVS